MLGLGMHRGRTLVGAACLLLAVGPLAARTDAQVPPGYGGYPGLGGYPGTGTVPDPSSYYGPGGLAGALGLAGLGGLPGYGMFPGMGGPYGMGRGVPFPGLPGSQNAAPPGSASGAANPTQNLRLTMGDNLFFPAEISVPAGTQITWLNSGNTQHTTTASDLWDSGAIAPGERWAAVFRVPGTYDYLCTIHPDEMRGRLTITRSSGTQR